MATKRYEQKLLTDLPSGGWFVKTDWFQTREMFKVLKHYKGYKMEEVTETVILEDGTKVISVRRVKSDIVIPKAVIQKYPQSGVITESRIETEGVYVMEMQKI